MASPSVASRPEHVVAGPPSLPTAAGWQPLTRHFATHVRNDFSTVAGLVPIASSA